MSEGQVFRVRLLGATEASVGIGHLPPIITDWLCELK
jgi:hypothetical protein